MGNQNVSVDRPRVRMVFAKKRNQQPSITRKLLILSVDQPGLEPVSHRAWHRVTLYSLDLPQTDNNLGYPWIFGEIVVSLAG